MTSVTTASTTTGSASICGGITGANGAPRAATPPSPTTKVALLWLDQITGSYAIGAVDGNSERIVTQQWLRDGSPFASVTASTYTLVAAGSGTSVTIDGTPMPRRV